MHYTLPNSVCGLALAKCRRGDEVHCAPLHTATQPRIVLLDKLYQLGHHALPMFSFPVLKLNTNYDHKK